MQLRISRDHMLRVGVAFAALSAIAVIAGRSLFPSAPVIALLAYALLGALSLFLLLLFGTFVIGTVYHAVLRAGGTDTQWLWFRSAPWGLSRNRGTSSNDPGRHHRG